MTKFTKVVATLGPACSDYETVLKMIEAGMDVARFNFSHGNYEFHKKNLQNVRKASMETGFPIGIFQDLQGPKIRVGQIEGDQAELKNGEKLIITTEECLGNSKKVSIDYPFLHEEVQKGKRILLDDGILELEVESITGKEISTRVVAGGILKPRKGVNLPHTSLKQISAFTEKDLLDLQFGFNNYFDFVALSFVRHADDVRALKDHMQKQYGRIIPVISKIEKPEAVDDLANILDVSDAIMVARGDLGVETSSEDVPMIQKTIIRLCNEAGKPVITATQMLDSMMQNPRPTRAEAADVANAIIDGTSAIMLSGETAAGKYPVESVEMMSKIAIKTESSFHYRRIVLEERLNQQAMIEEKQNEPGQAVAFSAIELAKGVRAKYLACFTHSGGTANLIARFRPPMPIVGFSPERATVRRLSLSWGVIPMEIGQVSTVDELLEGAPDAMKFQGLIEPGEYLVITAGVPVGKPGHTNMIKVVRIED